LFVIVPQSSSSWRYRYKSGRGTAGKREQQEGEEEGEEGEEGK